MADGRWQMPDLRIPVERLVGGGLIEEKANSCRSIPWMVISQELPDGVHAAGPAVAVVQHLKESTARVIAGWSTVSLRQSANRLHQGRHEHAGS
jgi:hypothetical protein